MSCGRGHRRGSDPALLWLWLWHRLLATALVGSLAREPSYAVSMDLKRQKDQKKKKKKTYQIQTLLRICLRSQANEWQTQARILSCRIQLIPVRALPRPTAGGVMLPPGIQIWAGLRIQRCIFMSVGALNRRRKTGKKTSVEF